MTHKTRKGAHPKTQSTTKTDEFRELLEAIWLLLTEADKNYLTGLVQGAYLATQHRTQAQQ